MATPKLKPGDPIADLVDSLLVELGEDPDRQGLKATPDRVARAMRELTNGYGVKPEEVIAGAVFDQDYDEMVVVKDINFYSLCEHHLLPFFGQVHVGYLPKGRVVGLSKIPRLVEVFSHRLQIQEQLTRQAERRPRAAWGGRGRGGSPPVHGDARRGGAGRPDDDLLHARDLPPRPADSGRVPGPRQDAVAAAIGEEFRPAIT
jgi:hypothetical protein